MGSWPHAGWVQNIDGLVLSVLVSSVLVYCLLSVVRCPVFLSGVLASCSCLLFLSLLVDGLVLKEKEGGKERMEGIYGHRVEGERRRTGKGKGKEHGGRWRRKS